MIRPAKDMLRAVAGWAGAHYQHLLLALFAGAFCLCGYFLLLIWDNTLSALRGTKDNSEDIRNLLLGFAALIAAPFIILRVWIAERQAQTAEQGLVTDRFTKAVEQLGATREVREWDEEAGREVVRLEPNIEVRLGAIYALERIAQDSERDHITIMEILCAYVRTNNSIEYDQDYTLGEIQVTQSILKIIGSRDEKRRYIEERNFKFYTNLSNCDLSNYNLFGLDFSRTNFSGSTLENSIIFRVSFKDCMLDHTKFSGYTDSPYKVHFKWREDGRPSGTERDTTIFIGSMARVIFLDNIPYRLNQFDGSLEAE